jgi:hypothetical protein
LYNLTEPVQPRNDGAHQVCMHANCFEGNTANHKTTIEAPSLRGKAAMSRHSSTSSVWLCRSKLVPPARTYFPSCFAEASSIKVLIKKQPRNSEFKCGIGLWVIGNYHVIIPHKPGIKMFVFHKYTCTFDIEIHKRIKIGIVA